MFGAKSTPNIEMFTHLRHNGTATTQEYDDKNRTTVPIRDKKKGYSRWFRACRVQNASAAHEAVPLHTDPRYALPDVEPIMT